MQQLPKFNYKKYQEHLLRDSLTDIFGDFSEDIFTDLESKLKWIDIKAGNTLFHQGDVGDSLYFVLKGRLKALVKTDNGELKPIGDIIRGESVGEMAILTGEKRMATITAVRDSLLVQLTQSDFEAVVKVHPQLSTVMTKNIVNRLNNAQNPRKPIKKPVNICFLPITEGVDLKKVSEQLHSDLMQKGKTLLLDSDRITAVYQTDYFSLADGHYKVIDQQLTSWLDEQESQHDLMLYVADAIETEWTQRCIREADEIYLVADAKLPPSVSSIEKNLLSNQQTATAPVNLILLHSPTTQCPSGTDKWLAQRNLKAHYHIRPEQPKDIARLARIISRTAIGLVLAGGGAKGFSHLGVYKALQEAGVPIDFIGGTSAGALAGMFIAFDLMPEKAVQIGRKAALTNPTNDYNFFPFISVIKGKRLEKAIHQIILESVGFDINMEDTWLPFFVVACNYTQATEVVYTRGRLFDCIRASISIPGAFPPVVREGHLMIDGGTFNNFPTDIMSRMGISKIIGVDLSRDKIHKLEIAAMPTGWELLRDKFRPKHKKKYRLPSLMSILLNTTVLYSSSRQKEAKAFTDLLLNPNVSKYGLLDWAAFDKILAEGYEHTKTVLGALTETELQRFKT